MTRILFNITGRGQKVRVYTPVFKTKQTKTKRGKVRKITLFEVQ